MAYRESQIEILKEELFPEEQRNGLYRGKKSPVVLNDNNRVRNFVEGVDVVKVKEYFKDNHISWWGGKEPTAHLLSSQIACVNHLFPVRNNREAVLTIARKIDKDIDDVELLANDEEKWRGYISFEVVSKDDHLYERQGNKKPTRGSNCTSIDALILARKQDKRILLAIEWKYTERYYGNNDKSKGEKGETRLDRYTNLIHGSAQLKSVEEYKGSVYFLEPFYQLMRQTLWAEQMVKYSDKENIKADDYIHVLVIPEGNKPLRKKIPTWEKQLNTPEKYVILSPKELLSGLPEEFNNLIDRLKKRYWKLHPSDTQ